MFEGQKIVLFEDQYDEGSIQFNNILNRIRSIYNIERYELDVDYDISFQDLKMLEIVSIRVPGMSYNIEFGFSNGFGDQTQRVFITGESQSLTFNEISNIYNAILEDKRYSWA